MWWIGAFETFFRVVFEGHIFYRMAAMSHKCHLCPISMKMASFSCIGSQVSDIGSWESLVKKVYSLETSFLGIWCYLKEY